MDQFEIRWKFDDLVTQYFAVVLTHAERQRKCTGA